MTAFQWLWLLSLFVALGIGYPVLKFWLLRERKARRSVAEASGRQQPSGSIQSDREHLSLDRLWPHIVLCSYLAGVILLGFFYFRGLYGRVDDSKKPANGVVKFIVLQLNDVYEIEGVSQGEEGGLARVATLRQQLLAENGEKNVITVLAGDTWSPSILGDAVVDKVQLQGRQMMDVLDAMGLDYATFGNHEFDLKEATFLERLGQSSATWISTNVLSCATGRAFEKGAKNASPSAIRDLVGDDGSTMKIGLIGLTIDDNQKDYSWYLPPASSGEKELKSLQNKVDVVLALTHLNLYQDRCLANRFSSRPDLAKVILIIGGHEHENVQEWRGADFIPITKADANARTVYVHRIEYSTTQHRVVSLNSQLVRITKAIPENTDVKKKVDDWLSRAKTGFKTSGFDVDEPLGKYSVPLDGLEAHIRSQETELTKLIGTSMAQRAGTDVSFYNAGSIRLDEVIPVRELTERDVLRILPFGGHLRKGKITGANLQKLRKESSNLPEGNGMFMQFHGIDWTKIQTSKKYDFASTDYMIQCSDKSPGSNPIPVEDVYEAADPEGDVRHVLMHQLDGSHGAAKLTWPAPPLVGCYVRPLSGSGNVPCKRYGVIQDPGERANECMSRQDVKLSHP